MQNKDLTATYKMTPANFFSVNAARNLEEVKQFCWTQDI